MRIGDITDQVTGGDGIKASLFKRQVKGIGRTPPDAIATIAVGCPVADAWLAHGNCSNAGHDLTLGQMAMPHNPLMAVFGFEVGMLGHEGRNLGFDSPGDANRAASIIQEAEALVV